MQAVAAVLLTVAVVLLTVAVVLLTVPVLVQSLAVLAQAVASGPAQLHAIQRDAQGNGQRSSV